MEKNKRYKLFALAITYTLFVFITVFGLLERENLLYNVISNSTGTEMAKQQSYFLQNDSNAFHDYALELPYPCFTVSRPPFFLIFTRTVLGIFGDLKARSKTFLKAHKGDMSYKTYYAEFNRTFYNHTILRQSSILLNLLVTIILFLFALKFAGKVVALITSLLCAANIYTVYYSVLYVRTDMMALLGLASLIILYGIVKEKRIKTLNLLLLVIVYSLAFLTRLSSLSLIVFSLLLLNVITFRFEEWKNNILPKSILIFSAVVLLTLPYLIFSYQKSGNMMPVLNHHAKFWRNQEFAGKPGYPSVEEVARNPYCGKDITSAQYIFNEHSFMQIVERYLKGYWSSFTVYLPKMFKFEMLGIQLNLSYLLFFMIPAVIYCFRKKEEGVLVMFFALIALFPFVFILPLNEIFSADPIKNVIGVEPRFNMAIMPYAFLFTAIGIKCTFSWLFGRVRKKQS